MTVRQPTDSEALVAVLAGEAETSAGQHPEVDQLLDYHAGRLSPEAAAGVLDHLVGCRRCTQILLDLESFPDAAASPSNVVDLAAVAGWRDFKSRIDGAQRPAGRAQGTPVRALYALAASLMLGVVGLSFWVADLRQTVAVAHMAQTNPLLVTLDPITRGEEPEGILIEASRERPFLLRVILDALELPDAVEAELVDAGGRAAWSDDGVVLDGAASFLLSFSRWSLPAGDYRLRVYGLDGDRREVLEERKLRVRYL